MRGCLPSPAACAPRTHAAHALSPALVKDLLPWLQSGRGAGAQPAPPLRSLQLRLAGRGSHQGGAVLAGCLPRRLLGRRRRCAGPLGGGLLLAPVNQVGADNGVGLCTFGQAGRQAGRLTGGWAGLAAEVVPGAPHAAAALHCRLEELEEIGREWRALQAAAHELDRRLAQTPWRTLCHGDFKSANLQFSDSRSAPVCAAVDFQYCGGGSGLKDVVYLLASAASPRLVQVGRMGRGVGVNRWMGV